MCYNNYITAFFIEIVENYLLLAKDRYGYGIDQALGMLYYHNYDITKAVTDLANFCPLKGLLILSGSNKFYCLYVLVIEDWSMEDKVIFEQAYRFHNKNFHRIKLMVRYIQCTRDRLLSWKSYYL